MNYCDGLSMQAIRCLVGRDDPTIGEIGAHDGYDSKKFLNTFPGIRLFCFEPDPRPIIRFKQRIQDDRCELIEAAISDIDGFTIMYRSSGASPPDYKTPATVWDASGSILQPTGHYELSPWVTFPDDLQLQVRTIRLDTWFAQHSELDVIDYLRIDVQGAEALLIKGGLETLAHTHYFYTEYYNTPMYEGQPCYNEIVELLPDGFEVLTFVGKTDVLFCNCALP